MRPPVVFLLHGLWLHAPAMRWFATRLRAQGFDAHPLGYYSLLESTDAAVAKIGHALTAEPGAHVVGHSLGGLLGLRGMEQALHGGTAVGRLVCLGSPLCGSRAADGVATRVPAGRRLLGQHLPLLLEGAGCRLPDGLEVGMIAGCQPIGLGGVVAHFDCEHDGTVAVEETRLPGLVGHVVVRASHSGLIFSDEAARHTVHFLREGCFAAAAPVAAIA